MQVRDKQRLLRFQQQMAGYKPIIVDELGFVPLSKTGQAGTPGVARVHKL